MLEEGGPTLSLCDTRIRRGSGGPGIRCRSAGFIENVNVLPCFCTLWPQHAHDQHDLHYARLGARARHTEHVVQLASFSRHVYWRTCAQHDWNEL